MLTEVQLVELGFHEHEVCHLLNVASQEEPGTAAFSERVQDYVNGLAGVALYLLGETITTKDLNGHLLELQFCWHAASYLDYRNETLKEPGSTGYLVLQAAGLGETGGDQHVD